MRLMAGVTSQAAGVIGRNDLREIPGLSGVRFVAADAQHSGVEFGRSHRGGIVSVLGERSVAGFAIHVRMLAVFLFVEHIRVTAFAGVVAGVIDGPRRNFGECIPPEVPVFAEALRYQKTPDNQKKEYAGGEHACQPEKMARISKGAHDKLGSETFNRLRAAPVEIDMGYLDMPIRRRRLCFMSLDACI